MMMETYHGHVRTPIDAIILFEACRQGILNRVQRRLSDKERLAITSGSVFVWDEREAGMRRWTDGKSWSASRVSGSFLTYREMEGKRSDNVDDEDSNKQDTDDSASGDGYRYKQDGLMKQSFSIETTDGCKLHLISYYSRAHITSDKLMQPSNDPNLKHIQIPSGVYPDSTPSMDSHHIHSGMPPLVTSLQMVPGRAPPGHYYPPQHQQMMPPQGYPPHAPTRYIPPPPQQQGSGPMPQQYPQPPHQYHQGPPPPPPPQQQQQQQQPPMPYPHHAPYPSDPREYRYGPPPPQGFQPPIPPPSEHMYNYAPPPPPPHGAQYPPHPQYQQNPSMPPQQIPPYPHHQPAPPYSNASHPVQQQQPPPPPTPSHQYPPPQAPQHYQQSPPHPQYQALPPPPPRASSNSPNAIYESIPNGTSSKYSTPAPGPAKLAQTSSSSTSSSVPNTPRDSVSQMNRQPTVATSANNSPRHSVIPINASRVTKSPPAPRHRASSSINSHVLNSPAVLASLPPLGGNRPTRSDSVESSNSESAFADKKLPSPAALNKPLSNSLPTVGFSLPSIDSLKTEVSSNKRLWREDARAIQVLNKGLVLN